MIRIKNYEKGKYHKGWLQREKSAEIFSPIIYEKCPLEFIPESR